MTSTPDIRWQQRLDNYGRALTQLAGAALFEAFARKMEALRGV